MTRIHEMNNPKIEAMRHPRTSLTAEDKKLLEESFKVLALP